MKRFLPVLLVIAGSLAPLRAQQPAPMDPKMVLTTLKDLRTKQAGLIGKEKTGVLAAVKAAIADPGKTYEAAVTAVELQGQGGSDPKRAADIRKRVGEQVRNREFVNGLRLQLAYLSLTWQHSMGVKIRDQIPALLEYTAQVSNAAEALSGLDMFKKTLGESVFVPYFQAGPYINGLADWSDKPFDVESIYQKSILPEMRKNKDPRLLDYWDNHLQTEMAHASATQNNLAVARFNHVRRPTLLWSRAEDEMVLGQNDQGAGDMLAIIKANPGHPDFEKWATQLEGIASTKAAPPAGDVAVGEATLVTPTPGVTATPVPATR